MTSVKEFAISLIHPEDKDYVRSLGLESDVKGIPSEAKALRMANAIKDPFKLVRRSKAVVGIWGTEDAWPHFRNALIRMGFTKSQIKDISKFEIDLDDLE
jgi:hypothetical protein